MSGLCNGRGRMGWSAGRYPSVQVIGAIFHAHRGSRPWIVDGSVARNGDLRHDRNDKCSFSQQLVTDSLSERANSGLAGFPSQRNVAGTLSLSGLNRPTYETVRFL